MTPRGHARLRRPRRNTGRSEILGGIAAVVLGYAAMAAFAIIAFLVAWLALGRTFAFEDGSTDVTLGWIMIALPVSFISAALGGVVARRIVPAENRAPVEILAGLVLIVGFLCAVTAQRRNAQTEPLIPQQLAAMSVFQAAAKARQPAWSSFLLPFVGAIGVRWGGGERHRRHKPRQT